MNLPIETVSLGVPLIVFPFETGQMMATTAICDFLSSRELFELLTRYGNKDWGDLCDYDKAKNEEALTYRTRLLLGSYFVRGKKIYVITQADRSATTVLFADEY